jgi:uncharacterized alkaline shock family protein YloU
MANNSKETKTPPPQKILSPEDDGSLGQIKINHSVVASIVRLATLEVKGVYAVGGSFVDGLAEMFSKKESDRGVQVSEDEGGAYLIDIKVVLKFGVELAKIALQIQENVIEKVQHMTMKSVNKVNVIIDGIKMTPSSSGKKDDTNEEGEEE